MRLVKGAWKLLVGIKDALVLVFMLLFFAAMFAVLTARPTTTIRDGALVLDLAGVLVEQPAEADPFAAIAGNAGPQQFRVRDVVRALAEAEDDSRVKAVVLDLDRFMGGYPADVATVAEAIGRVRTAGKPVLAYATAYTDSSYLLAANASEIWVDPQGGALFSGPGGNQLYYQGLIERLSINARVFRVGEYKAAVEPFTRSDQSPEARQANQALYGSIFSTWQDNVRKARPKAQIGRYLTEPAALIEQAQGDIARANLATGVIDRIGDRIAFHKRVAEIDGLAEPRKAPGSFKSISLASWIAAHPLPTSGDAVGVITVSGTIIDGEAGPGTAGGATISKLLLDGLAEKKLKALVVRVDSPGGSALASEQIRQAILQVKARGIPVVVSMGSLAASGGYWVSTPGDVIFAEPNTITGSIGIFALIPTFEDSLARIGVTSDGVQTTPLTGQPDILGGFNPEVETILQSSIEAGYRRFVNLVAATREMTPARVNQIGQGRVWDGGTARQLGLVDRFGGIDDAIAEAARRANLDAEKVHAVYLEQEPDFFTQLIQSMSSGEEEQTAPAADLFQRMGSERRAVLAQAVGDFRRLTEAGPVQVRCLECAGFGPSRASVEDQSLFDMLVARLLR